jgi:hypothetical protein
VPDLERIQQILALVASHTERNIFECKLLPPGADQLSFGIVHVMLKYDNITSSIALLNKPNQLIKLS